MMTYHVEQKALHCHHDCNASFQFYSLSLTNREREREREIVGEKNEIQEQGN